MPGKIAKTSRRAVKPARRVRVRQTSNPWKDCAGMWKDDPGIDEFVKAVADYRKRRNKDSTL